MSAPSRIAAAFAARYGAQPRLFRAPGRINIVGEHTDYSGGFALPAAIDLACTVAIAHNDLGRHRVFSVQMNDAVELPADSFAGEGRWSDYVGAVAASLRRAGVAPPPCDLLIDSDVPPGGGVSSSAALEVAATLAFLAMADVRRGGDEVARLARAAETDFVGAPCGPLDQIAAVHGRPCHALLLDCRSLAFEPAALPADAAFVLVDSGVRHAIVDGGYRARREDCEAAARTLGVASLRDARLNEIEALPERLQRRARHVLSENERTLAAAEALRAGDLAAVGAAMRQSHASLRDNMDVTCAETDLLAHIAGDTAGVFGARQMGGGFGGAVLALVRADRAREAGAQIAARYARETGRASNWRICASADGACEVTP